MKPQHRADRFIDADSDPREAGVSLGDERSTLTEYLRGQRLTLQIKCEGLEPINSLGARLSHQRCRCLAWCDTWQRSSASGSDSGSRAKM